MCKNKKGFTLIELIVIVAILGIIVTLAVPRFLGQTQEANLTKLKHDARMVQDASDRYYLDHGDWPFLLDDEGDAIIVTDPGRLEIIYKVQEYNEEDLGTDPNTGIVLYEIDFNKLKPYIRKLDSNIAYFVAARGNPDFGITVLNPEHEATKERVTNLNPSEESGGLREPETDEIPIYSASDLAKIGRDPEFPLNGRYIQMADIDLSFYSDWNPIGDYDRYKEKFTGIYDGNGFIISNLTISRQNAHYQGLFGHTGKNAELKNINIRNANVKGLDYVGGLVGCNEGYIEKCSAQGNTIGSGSVGILAGCNGGIISKSMSWGTADCRHGNGGGLVGSNNLNSSGKGKILYSYSFGNVIGSGLYTGGLVGGNYEDGEIVNCYATGNVSSSGEYSGGLVGRNFEGTISNCYSIGIVEGSGLFKGGLAGYNEGKIINSYWDLQTSGKTISNGGIGKSTLEMKHKSTFSSWDFNNVWDIIEGQSYPFLRDNSQIPFSGMD